ncbi:MAG: DNA translocase FtsK 4TM domain-containing protein [Nitrospirae bacterium]|nr:DNA translocase FtsK 4TM domain-containing protein [Nitrospirota bacterium]
MGVSTTAKRGDARSPFRQPSHLKHEVIGVLLITSSLLILLSLISFAPTDVVLFGTGSSEASPSAPTRNMIGMVGATLARTLFWLIGGGAYLMPFLLAMLGARCFVEGALTVTLRSAGGSVAALLFLSGLLHLELAAVPTFTSGLVYRGMAGGATGHLIADGLRVYFASTGAHIIVLAGLVISLLLATPMSLADLWRRVPGWWGSLTEVVQGLLPEPSERAERADKVKRGRPKPVKINRPAPVELAEAAVEVETPPEPVRTDTPSNVLDEPAEAEVEEPVIAMTGAVSTGYVLPDPRELLDDPSGPLERMTDEELKAQSDLLTRTLLNFDIEGKVTEVHPGPVVTMYEFEPAPGVKVARIVNLDNDLALALKATSLRIVAPLPGKSVVGIEVPNRYRETVSLKEVLTSDAFTKSRSKLTLALGKDIFGVPVTADLKTMPHLLVAGATGAGKSVSLNTMLLSILFSARPDEVKLLLVDPKMLEMQLYDGIPHLLRPVITDPKSAARGLGWVVQEMERRYKLLAEAGVRNVDSYNRLVGKQQGVLSKSSSEQVPQQTDLPIEFLSEEERLSAGESAIPESGPVGPTDSSKTPPAPLPYIVVMIDELADLMAVAPKEVEDKIARLAQMARASGIHLVLATQRPSVDVLTGLIKANFPARIAFQVSSKTDSRTILDANGAEALVGRGDMLYLASGTGRIIRLHGSFVADDDVRRVVEFVKKQATPVYSEELQSLKQDEAAEEQERDEVYEQAKDLVISSSQASASLIQRRLRVGYPRAARMIERMEQEGIVGAAGRDGRREVLVRRGPVGEEEA